MREAASIGGDRQHVAERDIEACGGILGLDAFRLHVGDEGLEFSDECFWNSDHGTPIG